jgi:hypothetical protein
MRILMAVRPAIGFPDGMSIWYVTGNVLNPNEHVSRHHCWSRRRDQAFAFGDKTQLDECVARLTPVLRAGFTLTVEGA